MTYQPKAFDPDTQYVAWNGDIRDKSTRWNGDSDMEDIGFMSRGIRSVSQPPLEEPPVAPTRPVDGSQTFLMKDVPRSLYSPHGKPPKASPVKEPEIKKRKR